MPVELPTYRHRGGALLRATTDPGLPDPPRIPDLGRHLDQSRAWLAGVWAREEIRTALGLASPALSHRIEALLDQTSTGHRSTTKAVLGLSSYLLRWRHRPTPFGVFAGIASVQVGEEGGVRWGGEHRWALQADAEWLSEVITRLEDCAPLRRRLPVVANNTIRTRGRRLVATGPPSDAASAPAAPIEVSVQGGPPVRAALSAARTPIPLGDLHAMLATRFPQAPQERITALLTGLMAQGMLISSLWAPMTCPDALGYLCGELTRLDTRSIPGIAALTAELQHIHDDLTAPATARVPAAPALASRMRALADTAPTPLAVDTVLDCELRLPRPVIEEAQSAAGVLARLTAHPYGTPHWRDYHHRFRRHYGPAALVPVTELLADSGLGLPATFLGSAREPGLAPRAERDAVWLGLIQEAMLDHSEEVVLSPDDLERLTVGTDSDLHYAPRIEICAEVHARSLSALHRGDFRLAVTGAPRPASSMAGRFAHLLDEDAAAELAATYRTPDTRAAQLSFPPRTRRSAGVARTPLLLPTVISLAEHRPANADAIDLDDLGVTADAHRFHLIQISTGRPVEPRIVHALEPGTRTPALARFLAEITTARSAAYGPLDLGAATRLTYLPRLRYRRTVLTPARWLLHRGELPGSAADLATWEKALEQWRQRWGVPEQVAVIEHDQRLPLDLTHPVHLRLLRRRLTHTERLELRETPPLEDYAWLGRPHEILLPLHLDAPRPSPSRALDLALQPATPEAPELPGGSTMLHAQLHAHPERFDELLTEHLPALIAAVTPLCWWFTRQRDAMYPETGQHLALYLRLPHDDDHAAAAARLHAWACELHRQHLLQKLELATYQPQTGRFGRGPVMEAAENVFSADTAAALTQIRTAATTDLHPDALAAASLTHLAIGLAPTREEGLSRLIHDPTHTPGPVERHHRQQALTLTDPAHLPSLPGGEALATAWRERATALAHYRSQLAHERDPLQLLPSLLHLHHIRAQTPHPDRETAVLRLARSCALRHAPKGRRR